MIARQPKPTGPGSAVGNKTVSTAFREILRTGPDSGSYSAPTSLAALPRLVAPCRR